MPPKFPKRRSTWYIYIIECSDKSLYTGITNDLAKRIACHNANRGGRYTRSRTPVKLVYRETCPSKSKALKREIQIKNLTRTKKLALFVALLFLMPLLIVVPISVAHADGEREARNLMIKRYLQQREKMEIMETQMMLADLEVERKQKLAAKK